MLKISHSIENFSTGHTEVKQTEPYIIFTVDNEEFGIEALKVLELVNYMAPLKMPSNFVNVQGMASYRGKIIPIIDLRKIFGLEPIGYDDATVTIVVESVRIFGITAERVLDLEFIPVISIKNIKAFNFGDKTKYLKSVANFGDRLVLLLDLDK
ncbi:MAG: chemotaxis protein CheW, partial [Bacteroidota bacterium]